MQRPALSKTLSAAEFESWYWLKSELVSFCRSQGLGTGGSKEEMATRISAHLSFRPPPPHQAKRTATSKMPDEFELSSVIGSGWRCTQPLRRFFQSHVGTSFRFNEALRTYISTGSGRTLNEALAHYNQSISAGPRPIAKQFEFNNHMREYRTLHPGSTHAEAVSAWWAKRGKAGA
jgi:hypothetical protein